MTHKCKDATISINGVEIKPFISEYIEPEKKPWYEILRLDDDHQDFMFNYTRIRATDKNGMHVEFSLKNASRGLNELINSDPYGENVLEIKAKSDDQA